MKIIRSAIAIRNVHKIMESVAVDGKKSGKNAFSHSQLTIHKTCSTQERSIQFIIKNPSLIKLELQIVTLKEEDKSFGCHSDCFSIAFYLDAEFTFFFLSRFLRRCECAFFSSLSFVCSNGTAIVLLGMILMQGFKE